MRTQSARWIAASLSAFFLPACVLLPVRLVPEVEQCPPSAPSVTRIAPPPTGTVMMAQGPNGQPIYLQAVPAPSEALPVQYVTAPKPMAVEEPEIVAVTHSAEPPLAPPMLPEPVRSAAKPLPPAKPEPAPAPLPKVVSKPAIPDRPFVAPPGAQYIVLQPSEAIQKTGHSSDAMPNLLSPPMPAEELKLVSGAKPMPTSTPLLDAVRSYQDNSAADGDRQLAHLDPINRDLLKKLLPLAVRLGDSSNQKADPAEIAEVVDQMQQMVVALRSKAALRIEKLCYCRAPAKPVRMGVYQPLPDDHAYRQGETIEVYMELKNFSCQAKDQEFATHLSTVLEIHDERGEAVSRFEFEREKPDMGSAPRNEYFHICRFPVQGLGVGSYTLKARITDVPTGKTATRELPLRIEPARKALVRGNDE